jgi:hypothetical protein
VPANTKAQQGLLIMAVIEIRKGLRRLDFTPNQDAPSSQANTHVLVEFEVGNQLADDQLVRINLGLRDGVIRELKGRPVLVNASNSKARAFMYRLEGDVA